MSGKRRPAPEGEPAERDDEAVRQFVERFATLMDEAGMPRMPARVFAALLATDSGRLTAAELGELLHVSPAAVSGAMRYLVQTHLASKERQPGTRRDVYQVHDDVWYEAIMDREAMMRRWEAIVRDGVDAVGRGTPAGRRLFETAAFISFYRQEVVDLQERWRKRRADIRDDQPPPAR